jgi:hypothetical protein
MQEYVNCTNRWCSYRAGLGILFAPAKGDKTRAKISDGYREAKADLDLKYQGLSEDMKTKLNSAKLILTTYEDLLANMSDKKQKLFLFWKSN